MHSADKNLSTAINTVLTDADAATQAAVYLAATEVDRHGRDGAASIYTEATDGLLGSLYHQLRGEHEEARRELDRAARPLAIIANGIRRTLAA